MNKFTFNNVIRTYPPVFLSIAAAIVLGRFIEILVIGLYHGFHLLNGRLLLAMAFNDLELVIITSIPFWGLLTGVRFIKPKIYPVSGAILISIIGILNLLLIIYFGDTLIPLGPEFWAYSPVELTDTVVAAGRVNLFNITSLTVILAFLYIGIKNILTKFENQPFKASVAGWFILIGGLIVTISYAWNFNQISSDRDISSNKLTYFLQSSITSQGWTENTRNDFEESEEYPFLHSTNRQDVLGPFFNQTELKPNIVFVVVESFGGEFMGKYGQWAGFTPFIDSLASEGLYWENGLSMSGRTFGMMPSLFGSLPPGRTGFMDEGPLFPNHHTLISLLKQQGYHTSFYSGFDTYFDGLDLFLEHQEIDYKLNKETIKRLIRSQNRHSEQNYWGYDDKTMLELAAGIGDTVSVFPRLEIYHTLQSHSPFTIPQTASYELKFNELLNQMDLPATQKAGFQRYRAELTTLLYTDDALRNFFYSYRKRDHFEDTIFIITGDHWLIPVPQTSQISRYHVPIIIYSPLIKNPVRFQSVNTHSNITPTLISYLSNNTGFEAPEQVHWVGGQMDTSRTFRNIHSLAMMKTKNQLNDYLDNDYFFSDGVLYELQQNLGLDQINDPDKKALLLQKLNRFKTKNNYVIQNNKLYPGSDKRKLSEEYRFLADYDTLFNRVDSKNMSVDEQFQLARKFAFDQDYEISRAISKRILIQNPGYHDVRILIARTYAWNGEYDISRELLRETLQRDSTYYDAYNALFDMEFWAGNYETAREVIERALTHHPRFDEFIQKKERVEAVLDGD